MENLGFCFLLLFFILFYFKKKLIFVLFLYNFNNFMKIIFVIEETLTLFDSLRGILTQLVVWRAH
jgi:hypothetical protein